MLSVFARSWLPVVLICLFSLGFWLQTKAPKVQPLVVVPVPLPPQLISADLSELYSIKNTRKKKQRFFALLRPLIVLENNYILQQRSWLKALNVMSLSKESLERQTVAERGLLQEQRSLLMQLARDYRIDSSSVTEAYQALLSRVNVIPIELVLVQAANESAWGKSRFARQGNNLFGQWCFSVGCGMVPARRPEGERYEVATFSSVQLSIRAYLHNLNTFSAYGSLRQQRAELEKKGEVVTGILLANSLQQYSQRGQAYVTELQHMIRINQPLIAQAGAQ